MFEPRENRYINVKFLPENWESVKSVLISLIDSKIGSVEDLELSIKAYSEVYFNVITRYVWLLVNHSLDVTNKEKIQEYNEFFNTILVNSESLTDNLKEKWVQSPYFKQLPDEDYAHFKKIIQNEMRVYSTANAGLKKKENELIGYYREVVGRIRVNYKGEKKTLVEMGYYLTNHDREIRKEAYLAIWKAWRDASVELDTLYSQLIEIRTNMAHNAGFANYRDYAHQKMGRISYTPSDVCDSHTVIKDIVVPACRILNTRKKNKLGVDALKPWDLQANEDKMELIPFRSIDELVDKTIQMFQKVDPEFAAILQNMNRKGYLDLGSRQGKANEAGFCNPLPSEKAAFLLMNSTGMYQEVPILCHEMGHALDHIYSSSIEIAPYWDPHAEIGELAAMGLELLCVDHYDIFYSDPLSLQKAKYHALSWEFMKLPWFTIMDRFQHWIYLHPDHTVEERHIYYGSLVDSYNEGVDWTGLEEIKGIGWMRDSLPFSTPFYFIEYNFATLGALGILRNYRQDQHLAIQQYKNFITLHYSKPLQEMYHIAGVEFHQSSEYITALVSFLMNELNRL